jgi:hypothetical protein
LCFWKLFSQPKRQKLEANCKTNFLTSPRAKTVLPNLFLDSNFPRSVSNLIASKCHFFIEIFEQVCMLAQALQIFWGKGHLVISRLISTLDKVIYFTGTR